MFAVTLHAGNIVLHLFGGLALFLYGMGLMTDSMRQVAGAQLKDWLARLTTNRFTGMLAGALTTALVQSSSVTTVLTISFITAGMMSFSQSIGVIIGANVGTTITAQIIAFKITKISILLIAIGFFAKITFKREKYKQYGLFVMGLGLLFFGMEMMSSATLPLRSFAPFLQLMQSLRNPLLGVLVGALFTALIQSSSATTGIVIILASQGLLSLEAGIALLFGANIGTCITALLSTIGQSREATKTAIAHVIFNVLGVLLWIAFIPQFASLVSSLSPAAPKLAGLERLAFEAPRQLANAHTLFNVANAFLFIGFTTWIARFINWLLPPLPESTPAQPQYIKDIFLSQPSTALDQARLEIGRMGMLVMGMLHNILAIILHGNQEDIDPVRKAELDLNALHIALIDYLGRLSTQPLSEPHVSASYSYMTIANNIENIGDIIDLNLIPQAHERISRQLELSPQASEMLLAFHQRICELGDQTLQAIHDLDASEARSVREAQREIGKISEKLRAQFAQELHSRDGKQLARFRIENSTLEYLERIFSLMRRIAEQLEVFLNTKPSPQTDPAKE